MKLFEFFGKNLLDVDGSKKESSDKLKVADDALSDKLFWFILDNDQLHKKYFMPIAREIYANHKKKGFNREHYVKKWMPMVNQGCLEFYKETKMGGDPKDLFTKEMRLDICHRLADQHHDDIIKGEYRLG